MDNKTLVTALVICPINTFHIIGPPLVMTKKYEYNTCIIRYSLFFKEGFFFFFLRRILKKDIIRYIGNSLSDISNQYYFIYLDNH